MSEVSAAGGGVDAAGGHVALADVGRVLERALGLHGEDWRIDRHEEWEGWSASLRTWCSVSDDTTGDGLARSCDCCDPLNLTDEDVALIEAAVAAHVARPEPGACGDPACPVLHDDPANPIHPCPVCWGEGCEAGCGRRGGCEMAYVGPDSHRICGHCHGSGEAPPAASCSLCVRRGRHLMASFMAEPVSLPDEETREA